MRYILRLLLLSQRKEREKSRDFYNVIKQSDVIASCSVETCNECAHTGLVPLIDVVKDERELTRGQED